MKEHEIELAKQDKKRKQKVKQHEIDQINM
jgi:hypothetical protein